MSTTIHANAILMSVSELKKSPTQAIDDLKTQPDAPVYILNRNEPVASLVSTQYVNRKEELEKTNTRLLEELDDQKYKIIALQRILNDDGTRISDKVVRGIATDTDLSDIEDEWV